MTMPSSIRALMFPDFPGDKPLEDSDRQAEMMERLVCGGALSLIVDDFVFGT
jgi:hypothetical protein